MCDNYYDELLSFNYTKNPTHYKIMAPGLRGPAVSPCNSEHTTRWGLSELHYVIKLTVNPIYLSEFGWAHWRPVIFSKTPKRKQSCEFNVGSFTNITWRRNIIYLICNVILMLHCYNARLTGCFTPFWLRHAKTSGRLSIFILSPCTWWIWLRVYAL